MFTITKENYLSYVRGSAFFATGGGLPPNQHASMFRDLLSRVSSLAPLPCEGFEKEATLVSVYGVGDPSQVGGSFDELVKKAMTAFEERTNTRIAGLIPGEIGAEALAFQASVAFGVPVLDSDLVGGRAAPEVSMDVFTVYRLPITPVLVMDMDGSTLFIDEPLNGAHIEERARAFLASRSSNGVLVGYSIGAGEYARVGMLGTLTRTFLVGEELAKGYFPQALDLCAAAVYAHETLRSCALESRDGFLVGSMNFDTLAIRVKNENMILDRNGEIIARAPDLIMVTTERGEPIHNADIAHHIGEHLTIVTVPAQGYWQEAKTRALWSNALV